MAEPRRYIGVRISEQGHRYIQQVADRDRINYSEALRRLLAVGAKTDMEAHDGTHFTGVGVERSAATLHERPDDGRGHRDLNGDRSSGEVSHVPHSDLGDAIRTHAGIGDAIGNLHRAGLNPSAIDGGIIPADEDDGPSAA